MTSTLRIAHLLHGCRTLGPGARTVVWVRGCARRCLGCIAAPILGDGPTLDLRAEELIEAVLATRDEGATFSGGEPFEQASALSQVAVALREAGRSIMAYTGNTLPELQAHPDPSVGALLAATDILVDGTFELSQQADLLWRGSSNQRVHLLSSRYQGIAVQNEQPGVGVEVRVDDAGHLFWAGVPPVGFVASLHRAAKGRGINLAATKGVWA